MPHYSKETLEKAVQFITNGAPITGVGTIANLTLPAASEEFRRCKEIKAIFEDYAGRAHITGPLSIAIFGPPGAGKSFCAKQLVAGLQEKGLTNEMRTANLSQIPRLSGLAKFFREVTKFDSKKTKVMFFDEFDATLEGEPLGWLRWFLAPMQDGMLLDEGDEIKLGKSILIFAGGTASSLDEFKLRAAMDTQFLAKKVPDFISRLRGFIDIMGVNNTDPKQPIRRALVLRHQLTERWPEHKGKKGFPIESKLARQLLADVHYVHGARSMAALLDTSRLPKGGVFCEENLPSIALRNLHISRGLLDGKVIGISASLADGRSTSLLTELSSSLLKTGATLAYGGDFIPGGTLDQISKIALELPGDLFRSKSKRVRNYLGFPSFHKKATKRQQKDCAQGVDFYNLETLSASERKALGIPSDDWFPAFLDNPAQYNPHHHLAWAISLFRMRVRLCQDIDALIVLGGSTGRSWGRFSGIAEEVMLALAFQKPIYLLGGLGGATQGVGQLMGFDTTIANPNTCLTDPGPIEPTSFQSTDCFSVPGYPHLPQTITELRPWLQARSVRTPAFPWNGLSPQENRELFCTPIPGPKQMDCVTTIVNGLTRLDWKTAHP